MRRWPASCAPATTPSGACSWPAPGRPVRPVPGLPRRLARRLGRRRRRAAQPGRPAQPLPADQRWQAALWRELFAGLDERERACVRPVVHQRFLAALASADAPAAPLPRRVVLFGTGHLPMQTLQALAALARAARCCWRCPTPAASTGPTSSKAASCCASSAGASRCAAAATWPPMPLEDMHAARPSAAGRLGRAGPRLRAPARRLRRRARRAEALHRGQVDLFDEGDGDTLLQQVQARIRDLVPLAEHPQRAVRADDRSIVFHVAHSAQREVEVLHDQLLRLLADPPGGQALHPRDIVVMVPDIDTFAPAIDAVFGQHRRARPAPHSLRHRRPEGARPQPAAGRRSNGCCACRSSAAATARCATCSTCRRSPRASAWRPTTCRACAVDGRRPACAGAWTAASAPGSAWTPAASRTPGCSACAACCSATPAAAGSFPSGPAPRRRPGAASSRTPRSAASKPRSPARWPALLERLTAWWKEAPTPATPAQWAARCRRLVDDFLAPTDEAERLTVLALHESLGRWLEACESAGFERAGAARGAREAWLAGVDEPQLSAPLPRRRRDLLHA